MKKNILINIPDFLVVDFALFIENVKRLKNTGKIYVATWQKTAMEYKRLHTDLEFIIYPNLDMNNYNNTFISDNPELEKYYDFNDDDLDNFDTAMRTYAYKRYVKDGTDIHFNVNSIKLGIDVYSYFVNFFRLKKISLVYGVIQEHSSSDSMLYKAAVDSESVKSVLVRKPLGLSDKGMERFFIYDYKNNFPYKLGLQPSMDSSLKKERLFGDWGIQESSINVKKSLISYIKKIPTVTPNKLLKFGIKQTEKFIFFKYKLPKLAEYYDKLTSEINFDEKYILYSLHFEPESTIYPSDGINSLQLYNIRIISTCLPKGWKIYVKEHPTQFNKKAYLLNDNYRYCLNSFRSKEFYDYLVKIPNVKMINIRVSQKDLIEKAKIVASNSGSALLESSVMNKPCLAFGSRSFVNILSNVWKVSDIKNCKNAIKDILLSKDLNSNYQKMINDYTYQVEKGSCYLKLLPEILEGL